LFRLTTGGGGTFAAVAGHESTRSRYPWLWPTAQGDRDQVRAFLRRILLVTAFVTTCLIAGAVALAAVEHTSFWYSLRWAFDSMATLGTFDQAQTTGGQAILVVLILTGVGTLFWGVALMTEFFGGGHLGEALATRRAQKMIDSLNDHHIICGYGRVGRQVARDLRASGEPFVVVDSNPDNLDPAISGELNFIHGDAASDDVLREAGIERARSIVVCADSDTENVFITLTARELRGDVAIVARAAVEDAEKKLKRAGANRVISPYKTSGTEMARLALHPQLSGVVDVDVDYRMEEIVVAEDCAAASQRLGDVSGAAIVVGLRRGSTFIPQPSADTVLQAGDVIVAMGTPATLDPFVARFEAVG
jgi:voltage-gated potassium channel